MPPRNLGNRNTGIERLGDDPPFLLGRPAPAASYPGANVHPPARELRVAYSVAHMCETFPPNQQEDCNIPRASIKVGWENRLRCVRVPAMPGEKGVTHVSPRAREGRAGWQRA